MALEKWWYNTIYHSGTKIFSFEALYGYPPPNLHSYVLGTSANETLDQNLKRREQILTLFKGNLELAQRCIKQHIIERKFQEGDWVYLML